jgi:hypothetical protein
MIMSKTIGKQKLERGKRTLKSANDSIDLVRKFPLKNKGFVKPKEDGWFEALRNKSLGHAN